MKLRAKKPWVPLECRTFKRFAFFPTWMGEFGLNRRHTYKLTYKIWLESYYVQLYKNYDSLGFERLTVIKKYQ